MALDDWSAPALRQIEGYEVKAGVVFRLATSPVIRLWGGVGKLTLPADAIEDTENAPYSGAGELLDVPALSQLINGIAERVDFQLSGTVVTGEVAAIASSEADEIQQAVCNVGVFAMDEDFQRLSPVAWLWEGEADSLLVERRAEGGGRIVRTLTLSVGSVMTGRRRPQAAYFTDPDQRSRSPTDAFFDRIRTYEQGTTKVWPE